MRTETDPVTGTQAGSKALVGMHVSTRTGLADLGATAGSPNCPQAERAYHLAATEERMFKRSVSRRRRA